MEQGLSGVVALVREDEVGEEEWDGQEQAQVGTAFAQLAEQVFPIKLELHVV
jgi:hypothetical protein